MIDVKTKVTERPPERTAVTEGKPMLDSGLSVLLDTRVTVFGSFVPRGDRLALNGVEMRVPIGVRRPFIAYPAADPEHIPSVICFAGGSWWPMMPDALSEALGIPEEELNGIIWQFGQNVRAEPAEKIRARIQSFRQRNPPAEVAEGQPA